MPLTSSQQCICSILNVCLLFCCTDVPKEEMDQIIELVREEEEMKVRRIKLLGLDKFSMLADKYK
jgi:hypothetical protein